MKNTFTALMLVLVFAGTAAAEGGDHTPANKTGVGLNFNLHKNNYETMFPTNNEHGPNSSLTLNPYVSIPISKRLAIQGGFDLYKYRSEYFEENKNSSLNTESAFGPNISLIRYCDPCYSEDDCLRFFGYTGIGFDYVSGNSTYKYMPYMGQTTSTGGKVSYFNTNILAGFNYRILGNINLNGQVNVLSMYSDKYTRDANNKNAYSTNKGFDFINTVTGGIRVNF